MSKKKTKKHQTYYYLTFMLVIFKHTRSVNYSWTVRPRIRIHMMHNTREHVDYTKRKKKTEKEKAHCGE